MSKAKKTQEINANYRVRVVYGFIKKLKIVLLGEILDGDVEEGMFVHLKLGEGNPIGSWEIIEILKMDFINDIENKNFIGLMLKCKDEADFKLLQSLRVYGETITINQKA